MRNTFGWMVVLLGAGLVSCSEESSGPTPPTQTSRDLVIGRPQQPDLGPIFAVHQRYLPMLLAVPGVAGSGVGLSADGLPAIKVFAADARGRAVPPKLDGYPVEVTVTGKFFADDCTFTTCANGDVWPLPVPIGVSTSHGVGCPGFGTIGARVKAGTSVWGLSNNHIWAGVNTVSLGTAIYQPSLGNVGCNAASPNNIGTLAGYRAIQFCSSGCPSNPFDAALARSTTAKLDRRTPPGGYGTPNSVAWAPITVNAPVKKYGARSSLTRGSVFAVGATVTVTYPGHGDAKFTGQVLIAGCSGDCSLNGDSGSLWVSDDATANPIALHFASSSSHATASPIGPILTYFGVTVDGNPPRPSATGGFVATCGFGCSQNRITSVTASSNRITISGSGGSGLITLSGMTASGGLVASCGQVICTNEAITSVTGSGNTITIRDNGGHTGTITISGASVTRGLTANCAMCSNPRLTAITANGINGIFLNDTGGHTDYLKFQ